MIAYWCELAWLGGDEAASGVSVEIEGETIIRVQAGVAQAPPQATVLRGLTLPGLANAHSHAFHRALRSHAQRGRGSFWSWREQMYEIAARLDPETYSHLARATFAEMALAGITAVGEFHYVHHGPGGVPYSDPNELGRVMLAAAREAGIRITLLDTCYLHGGIGKPVGEVQRRFSDGDVGSWAARVEALEGGPGARIGAAIHSVRAVDPESAASVADWAARRECPLHAHVSEQSAENRACLEAHGLTPTGVLEDAGALAGRFTAVHATNLEDSDITALGSSAAWCCLCPTTERDLADGIGPASRLVAAGTSLALGSDSHAIIDLFEEARAVELDERLATRERGNHDAASLLSAATRDGHASLGWPEAGRIEPGARADLVTVGLDGVRIAGTSADTALEAVVFAGTAADVRQVICDGRVIVRDSVHAALDVASELRSSIAEVLG